MMFCAFSSVSAGSVLNF